MDIFGIKALHKIRQDRIDMERDHKNKHFELAGEQLNFARKIGVFTFQEYMTKRIELDCIRYPHIRNLTSVWTEPIDEQEATITSSK